MEMNGQWMKNKNLPLMRPGATWTWVDYDLKFKSMVVPVTKGRLTSKNVLILDTPQKLQLMTEHFPQWLIDNHCSLRSTVAVPELKLPAPALTDEQRRRIQRNKQVALGTLAKNELPHKKPMIHESVEAPNGEMIMLEYSTPSERFRAIAKFEEAGGFVTHADNQPCPMMNEWQDMGGMPVQDDDDNEKDIAKSAMQEITQAALNARDDNCANANGSPASPTGAVFDE